LDVAARVAALDWAAIERALGAVGYATTPSLLAPADCAALVALYPDEARFRSRVDMARHRFGVGEYKYFAEPLPPAVEALRVHAYPPLARIANGWMAALGAAERFPDTLAALRALCAAHGQRRPTPLLLRYGAGGYNCLHQDIYGDVAFPLQLTVFLGRPGVDYAGGEFLLVEQRPRAQSRAEVVAAGQGEAVIFPTRHRPVAGARGHYRATVRHGVSRVHRGDRYTLGVIFHDAR
jgi:hypothetical protein